MRGTVVPKSTIHALSKAKGFALGFIDSVYLVVINVRGVVQHPIRGRAELGSMERAILS